MPATVADPNRSLDSEQISPATIAHHTVYEKTPNLHQSHICQWGAQPYLVGPLSRLVGKPPHSPWVSPNVLPLPQVGNNTNSAISLTEIFGRVFSDVCNSLGFEVQKQKKRGSGNNRVYRNLKRRYLIVRPRLQVLCILPRFRADFVAKVKHALCSESAIVAILSYTDRTTLIQLLTHSMRHSFSDSIFTSPILMVA